MLHFVEPDRTLAAAIPYSYNWGLVMLSVLVAVSASYASFLASERQHHTVDGSASLGWLAAGAIAMGFGVWSMHFVGMLAVNGPFAVTYDLRQTGLSVIPVVIASAIALFPKAGGRRFHLLTRSLVLGSGIGVMHYVGMMGMRIDGAVMRYDLGFFLLSILVAVVLAYAALLQRERTAKRVTVATGLGARRELLLASLVMGSAISGMHYTGMVAVRFFADNTEVVDVAHWDPTYLALLILLVMAGILVILLTSVYLSRNASLMGEVKISQKRLQGLFDTVPNGLVTLDKDYRVQAFNPAAQQMFGVKPEMLAGQRLCDLVRSDQTDADMSCEALVSRCRSESCNDLVGVRHDGSLFPLSVQVSETWGAHGESHVVVLNDITEAKRIERSLREAKDAAESASRAKSAFLAAMSHEIRTPMNGVVGMIDVLGHTELSDEQQDTLRTIRDSAFSLLRILDDVLDFSKIEAGRMELENTPADIERLAESVRETLLPLADDKGLEVMLLVSPHVPRRVQGDPVRIRQILFNLLGNAIKFTSTDNGRDGCVQLIVDMDKAGKELRIRIIDDGIGIAPEVQSRLFQSFAQAEDSTTRRFGGTGLGLVISRRLVELMGGRITLQSEPGVGTTFSVFLPVETLDEEGASFGTDLNGITVFVQMDESTVARGLSEQLAYLGAEVIHATPEMLEGRVAAQGSAPENTVIVLDERHGVDRTAAMRDRLRDRMGPAGPRFVLLHRGRRRAPRLQAGDSVGLDVNYMTRSNFCISVGAVVGRVSTLPTGPVSEEQVELPCPEAMAQRHRRRILVAEDNSTNREVIARQMALLGYVVDMAHNGRQAIDMWRDGRYELILTDCHMPEVDGYELTRTIRRAEPEGQRIPIIAITADALKGTGERCLKVGMDDYLTKPVQLSVLGPKLDRWLAVAGDDDDVAVPGVASESTPDRADQLPAIEAGFLAGIVGTSDTDILHGIYAEFVDSAEQIADALISALQQRDLVSVREAAHKLKSSARTVGAAALAGQCEQLEQGAAQGDESCFSGAEDSLRHHLSAVAAWVRDEVAASPGQQSSVAG